MKSKPEETKFLKFLADTWPPKKIIKFGSWTIRTSDGAGKRASAISLDGLGRKFFQRVEKLFCKK